ncbi:MAG TPA: YidC/Oxa1 family membrane protein insertase [Clostridia bacterium]
MLDFIAFPLGKFLLFIYEHLAFLNYGLAIIIFTVIIKIILLPLNIKQYQSMARTQEVQPKLQEIQKRYKDDKEKLNQELMNFYKENNINPMGGCLPMLIQMPILFSLYYVISQPLKFMLSVGAPKASIMELVSGAHTSTIIKTIKDMFLNIDSKAYEAIGITSKFNKPDDLTNFVNSRPLDIYVINYGHTNPSYLNNFKDAIDRSDLLNMNFFHLNLGLTPRWDIFSFMGTPIAGQYIALLIIPVLAAFTTFLSIKYTSMTNASSSQGNDMAQSMNKNMLVMMPIMTGFFAFSTPAGLGVYWCVNNIIQILQQMFMNKFILKKKEEVAKKQNGV